MANDDELAMEGIKEEAEAYISYKRKARMAHDAHTREVFDDIADEELVHLGEFSEVAERARPEVVEKVKEGYEEAKEMKKSGEDMIPTFKSMMDFHTSEKNLQFNKSGGGNEGCCHHGMVLLGRGKRYPGLMRANDVSRDYSTGQFSQPKTNAEGCHKEEVKITGLHHMEKSADTVETEKKAEEPIEKSVKTEPVAKSESKNWFKMI